MKSFSQISTAIDALNEGVSQYHVHAEVSAGNIPMSVTKKIPVEARNMKEAHKAARAHAKERGWKVHQIYRAEPIHESETLDESCHADDAMDKLEEAGAKNVRSFSAGIRYDHKGKEYTLRHHDKADGHRSVRSNELQTHLSRLNEEEINELSRETYGRYIKAAQHDRERKEQDAHAFSDIGHAWKEDGDNEKAATSFRKAGDKIWRADKRKTGINKAVDKLVKS